MHYIELILGSILATGFVALYLTTIQPVPTVNPLEQIGQMEYEAYLDSKIDADTPPEIETEGNYTNFMADKK